MNNNKFCVRTLRAYCLVRWDEWVIDENIGKASQQYSFGKKPICCRWGSNLHSYVLIYKYDFVITQQSINWPILRVCVILIIYNGLINIGDKFLTHKLVLIVTSKGYAWNHHQSECRHLHGDWSMRSLLFRAIYPTFGSLQIRHRITGLHSLKSSYSISHLRIWTDES